MNEVFSSIKSGEQLALFSLKINRSPSTYLKSSAMSSIIFLICVLIPFVRGNCDDTPAIVDEQYGKDMYCQFAYFGAVDPNNMKKYNSPKAEKFGEGRVKGYKVGFTKYSDGTAIDTLVEDCKGVACGMAYLVPVSEFEKVLNNTLDDNNEKFQKLITVSVDLEEHNQKISLHCNAFQKLTPPKGDEKPCENDLQIGIDAYIAGQLSQHCIDDLKKIESIECDCTPPP